MSWDDEELFWQRHSERKDAEIKRLNALATCRCGDGFTADDPGQCGNCSVAQRLEIERLKAQRLLLAQLASDDVLYVSYDVYTARAIRDEVLEGK